MTKEILLLMLGVGTVWAVAKGNGELLNGEVPMKRLLDAKLKHTGKVEFVPDGPKEGELVGGGEGTVQGRLSGKMRWSLYENSTPRGCTMQLPGEILTDDGARISFQGQGHAIVPDKNLSSHWKVGGAFRFQTKDKRYLWLNRTLALWEGDFNMESGEAHYRLYAPIAERKDEFRQNHESASRTVKTLD